MKYLILMILFVGLQLPSGHNEVSNECNCAKEFKDTRQWSKGKRGAYYCMATSKSNKVYKRYLSEWLKLKNK